MAFASQEGGNHHTLQFLGKTFNFLVLFGLLAYLLYRPLKSFLSNYAEKQRKTLEDADRQKEEAERRLREIEERLNNIDAEMKEIIEKTRKQAEKERELILKQAAEERDKMKKVAQEEIQNMYENAVKKLRSYAAELAVSIAEEKVKKELDPEKQRKLIDYYIEKLQREEK